MALIDLRFTSLPKPTVVDGLDEFKAHMFQQGFSVPHESDISQFEVAPQNGGELAVRQQSIKRWDLIKRQRNQSITLTNESLTLRSTVYKNFEEFKSTWELVIDAFFKSFKGIENAGILRLGLRHMDVFIASENDCIYDYINSDWLTPQQKKNNDSDSLFLNMRIKNTNFGKLRVEIEERTTERGFNLFPRDISDPEPVSLKLEIKPHWKNNDSEKYAIIDIDHAWQATDDLESLTKSNIIDRLQGLYKENSDTFWSLLSHHAENVWEKKSI